MQSDLGTRALIFLSTDLLLVSTTCVDDNDFVLLFFELLYTILCDADWV